MSERPAEPGRPAPGAEGPEGARSLAQRTLDVLVFGPAGMLLTAVEDLPAFAVKGRDRLTLEIRNAKVVGEYVVTKGRRVLPGAPKPRRAPRPAASPPAASRMGSKPEPPTPGTPGPGDGHTGNGHHPGPEAVAPPEALNLAIPDYGALSASQVVRRLDGLGPADLEAVYRHEAGTRRRRTILHRAQQLLGAEETPGSPGASA